MALGLAALPGVQQAAVIRKLRHCEVEFSLHEWVSPESHPILARVVNEWLAFRVWQVAFPYGCADADVYELDGLTSLQRLLLLGSNVTDRSVAVIKCQSQLEDLALYDTSLSPDGIAELCRANGNLKSLRIYGDAISARHLEAALANKDAITYIEVKSRLDLRSAVEDARTRFSGITIEYGDLEPIEPF